jgi:hypothetical protein
MIDSTPIIVSVIASIPGFIASIVGLLAWRSSRKNGEAVKEIHLLMNSRLDELLRVSKANSKAEGVVEGRAEQKGKKNERSKT